MINQRDDRSSQAQLLGIIRKVRNRWRLKIALRGAAIVLGVGFLVFLATAFAVDQFRYSDGSVLAFRIVSYVAVLALIVRFLILPLLPRVSDERVALYLEEHEPSLDAAVLSAVEVAGRENAGANVALSPALAKRLVENAVQRSRAIDDGRRVERLTLFRSSGALAGVALGALAILLLGPPFLKHSAKLLLFPFNVAEAASPYRVELEPGNTRIPRGGDQKIQAALHGFEAEVVELAMKRGAEGEWQRMSMVADVDSGNYVFLMLDIEDRTEYYVEASGVRSPVYTIDVVDLPYVQKIEMEYRFPAYTGLSPQQVEEGGDIAALKGTVVNIRAVPTMPTPAGRIIVEGGDTIPMTVAPDGSLSGRLTVSKEGFYKIELEAPDKSMVKASLDYTIDVLVDQPPSIRFREPGRDVKVSSVEEVFTEVVAEDDYGVQKVELVYSVNGAAEQTRSLHSATSRRTPDVSAGHTFLLEELGLEAGDFISYYARAVDNNSAGGSQIAATDIYFMEIRPYGRDYRQAEQPPGGGGGGGGGGEDPQALSRKQRDIIAGTYKVVRDRARYTPKEFTENLATLRLAQEKLREDVAVLGQRLIERGIADQDSGFAKIAAMLPKAAEEMKGAEARLGASDPKGALTPEQRALQQLQRAEAVFREVMVSQGGGGGGGGGGGEQQNAEDLADLFELERDRMRNQYETVERAQAEQADRAVDETLEKLKQLASRQQQENDRMRRKADSLRAQGQQQGGGGGGGGGQRQLAQEAEEMARQLERLSRERSSPELGESARQLQQAADDMKRAASSTSQEGTAAAGRALDRLQEARRLLDNNRTNRVERDVQNAAERARKLAEQQRQVMSDLDRLRQSGGNAEQERQLLERKEAMADEVRSLRDQLDRMAADSRREQREASRRIAEAADSIRDNKIEERIRYSKSLVRGGEPEYAASTESQIARDLESLKNRLEKASDAVSEPTGQRAERSLEEARNLVRGLESLDERMRQRAEQGAQERRLQGQQGEGQQGQGQQGQGQQGQGQQGQGQQGQEGQAQGQQQGRQGGQGQQGQRGQGEQGRGQQGQQGEGQQQGQGQGQGQQGQGQGQQGQGQQGQGQQGQGQGEQGQGQQGQQGRGQQGQGGQQGARPPGSRGLGGNAFDDRGGSGGGPLSASDRQQFSRELRERREDAENLRRELAAQGYDVSDLDRILERMRQLGAEGTLRDTETAQRLAGSVIEGLKAYEYALRRQIEGTTKEKLFLGGNDDVPEGFRKLVEEYYKSLSTRPPKP